MGATSPPWSRRSGSVNRADVVFSTVDTVGIPLMLLARSHVARSPFVYTAIGLPNGSHDSARTDGRLYAQALAAASALVPYSRHEADVLAGWLSERGADVPVEFVPFGVDVEHSADAADRTSTLSRSERIRIATFHVA